MARDIPGPGREERRASERKRETERWREGRASHADRPRESSDERGPGGPPLERNDRDAIEFDYGRRVISSVKIATASGGAHQLETRSWTYLPRSSGSRRVEETQGTTLRNDDTAAGERMDDVSGKADGAFERGITPPRMRERVHLHRQAELIREDE